MPSVSPFAALKSAFEPIATAPPPASAMGTAKSVMPNPVASEIPSTLRPPQNSFAARVPKPAYPAAEIRSVRDSRDRRLRLDALRPDAGGTTAKLPATSPLDGLSAPTPKTEEGKIASKALEDAIAHFAKEPGAKKFLAGAGTGFHDNGPMGTSSYLMGYTDKAKVERAAEMLNAYLGAQRPGIHVTVEQGSQITGQFDTESSVYFLKFSVSNTTESW